MTKISVNTTGRYFGISQITLKITNFADMSKKERITKGKEGYRYESEMYGCYDKGMAPHPSWDVPNEYIIKNAGSKGSLRSVAVKPQFYIGSRNKRMIFSATYHPFKDFIMPKEATFMSDGGSSAKLAKNKRKSIVLYMSPVKRNSFELNTCPMASLGCEAVCLDYSGQKVGQAKQRLAIARTDFYFAHRDLFWQRTYDEIMSEAKKLKSGDELAVRLNGTSDLPLFDEFCDWCVANNKVKGFPKNILFYDYTKIANKVTTSREQELMNPLNRRHKVTYSLSEKVTPDGTGFDTAKRILLQNGSVAAVFKVNPRGIPEFNKSTGKRNKIPKGWVAIPDGKGKKKYYAPLPETAVFNYQGREYRIPVYDGDASDDLMLDLPSNKPYILGLRAKNRGERDTSGFAIPLFAVNGDPTNDPQIKEFMLELKRDESIILKACGLAPTRNKEDFKCSDDQTGTTIKTW